MRSDESHRHMVAHWLGFSQKHRGALLKGVFRPHHPEALYPVLEGEDARTRILTAYTTGCVVERGNPDRDVIVVNATGRKGLVLRLLEAPSKVEMFDTYGNHVSGPNSLSAGIRELAVPESGYVRLVL